MPSESRLIRGPCFDCEGAAPEFFCWCLVFEHTKCGDTAPVPKLDPETRPNVPPRMMS